MILEVDMGNTRLKWRVRNSQVAVASGAIGVEDSLEQLTDSIDLLRGDISSVCVASVVGATLEQRFSEWSHKNLGLQPLFARSSAFCGAIRNGYRRPELLGVDRWLGMLAAHRLAKGACIVVSCGTAITVDLLGDDGGHQGGYIAPGLKLMLGSLRLGTRQVQYEDVIPALDLSPGAGTSEAVYSAIAAMLTGLIDNSFRQLKSDKQNAQSYIVITGGDASRLLPFYPQALLVADLVLDGLIYIPDHPEYMER